MAVVSSCQFDIPVVTLNGRELARHRVAEAALLAALQQQAAQDTSADSGGRRNGEAALK